MRSISDSAIRNLLIAALIIMIIILGLFSASVFASDGSVLIGGRISMVIPAPSPLGTAPGPLAVSWICAPCAVPPGPPACCPPPGDLQQRLIGPQYSGNTLADVFVYSPYSAKRYTSILIPKSSRTCASPRPGAFFLGKGIPARPGQNALLMTVIGCSK